MSTVQQAAVAGENYVVETEDFCPKCRGYRAVILTADQAMMQG